GPVAAGEESQDIVNRTDIDECLAQIVVLPELVFGNAVGAIREHLAGEHRVLKVNVCGGSLPDIGVWKRGIEILPATIIVILTVHHVVRLVERVEVICYPEAVPE